MRQRRDAALLSLRLMLVASIAFPLLLFCFASRSCLPEEPNWPAIQRSALAMCSRMKMTDRLVFPISKRRSDSSGTFAGITEISVAPQAIEGYFARLAAKTSASFALSLPFATRA
jgi:hypothetical protein